MVFFFYSSSNPEAWRGGGILVKESFDPLFFFFSSDF
jgi:hypothetical protein